jgi:hypothetical protein
MEEGTRRESGDEDEQLLRLSKMEVSSKYLQVGCASDPRTLQQLLVELMAQRGASCRQIKLVACHMLEPNSSGNPATSHALLSERTRTPHV